MGFQQAALGHLRLSATGNRRPETGPDWQSGVGCSGPLKDSILYERRAGVAFVKQEKTPHTWASGRPRVRQGWGHTAGRWDLGGRGKCWKTDKPEGRAEGQASASWTVNLGHRNSVHDNRLGVRSTGKQTSTACNSWWSVRFNTRGFDISYTKGINFDIGMEQSWVLHPWKLVRINYCVRSGETSVVNTAFGYICL